MENKMKHYLTNNEIRAIEEGQEFLVKADWVLLSDEELYARLNPPKTEEQLKAEDKAEIARQLEVLTVTTTNGNTFDANNQARLDMQNAITSSDFVGVTQTIWRMADDSDVLIELAELKEALTLAIQKYAQLKGIV